MPAANLKRINLDLIYFPFLEKILELLVNCEVRGAHYIATFGYRSYGEQDALFAQGRSIKGKKVTNARGGQSAHNFGLAIDFTRDLDPTRPGLQPGWNAKDYLILATEAVKLGLHSGRSYQDWPHVAWPGFVTAQELRPLDLAYQSCQSDLTLDKLKEAWRTVENG